MLYSCIHLKFLRRKIPSTLSPNMTCCKHKIPYDNNLHLENNSTKKAFWINISRLIIGIFRYCCSDAAQHQQEHMLLCSDIKYCIAPDIASINNYHASSFSVFAVQLISQNRWINGFSPVASCSVASSQTFFGLVKERLRGGYMFSGTKASNSTLADPDSSSKTIETGAWRLECLVALKFYLLSEKENKILIYQCK